MALEELAEVAKEGDKEYIAQKMGLWFKERKIDHFLQVAEYQDGRLYDHNVAKRVLGECIAEESKTGNLKRLNWFLDLPQYLIDETNPEISGFVSAYRITQQTKGTE